MGKESQVLGSMFPDYRVTMDAQAFDNALRNNGLPLIHHRAMRCPGGLTDIDDIRRPHADHAGCSGGFLYKSIGIVTTLMTGNGTNWKENDIGLLNGSTITVSFPRNYDDPKEKQVLVLPYDRFFLTDSSILTAEWQLVRAHESGSDRCRFPVAIINHIVDAQLVEYGPESYQILEGDIVWNPGLGPAPGTVYTVHYQYQPYWYVTQLIHEIRVVGTRDYVSGKAGVSRMPFAAHLTRENVHRTEEQDGTEPTVRTQAAPADGGFGVR